MSIEILLNLVLGYVTPEVRKFLEEKVNELYVITKATPNGVDDILTEKLADLLKVDLNK